MKNRATWLIAVVVLLFGLSPAKAAITLSNNLPPQPQAGLSPEFLDGDYWAASSFGTGTQSWLLYSVTLFMSASSQTAAQVDIYKAVTATVTPPSTQPGSLYATLTSPAKSGTTLEEYTFTPSGSVSLDANSTYWVVLHALGIQEVEWAYTPVGCTSCGSSDITGGFQNNWRYSDNGGASWNFANNDTGAFMMRVDAIPEPSTLMLFGATALLLGLGYRRQAGNIA